jgi:lysophospholipase L1-like esterase
VRTSRGARLARWAGLVAAVAAILLSSACSSAKHHASGSYLALGDSLAFGYRPETVTDATTYAKASNFVGYPELVAQSRQLKLTNASCPGETSSSFIVAGKRDNGCVSVSGVAGTSAGYREKYPLHTKYTGAQLTFAVSFLRSHRDTQLVTLDLGVNDLLLCVRATNNQCSGSLIQTQLAQTGKNLTTILAALRTTAGYRGTIVVLTNYPSSYADAGQVAANQLLNTVVDTAAKAAHAMLADGFGAFEQASAAFNGAPCAAGLLIKLPTGSCDYHASDSGQQLLAQTVEHAIATS